MINITKWGGFELGNSGSYFRGAIFLADIMADDVNLTGTTDFSEMFRDAIFLMVILVIWMFRRLLI